MFGVVNSIHWPAAVDTSFTQTPPLAATSAPLIMGCPLPLGERLSASNRMDDCAKTIAGSAKLRAKSKTDRKFRMPLRLQPSLRLDDIEALLVAAEERKRSDEIAVAVE